MVCRYQPRLVGLQLAAESASLSACWDCLSLRPLRTETDALSLRVLASACQALLRQTPLRPTNTAGLFLTNQLFGIGWSPRKRPLLPGGAALCSFLLSSLAGNLARSLLSAAVALQQPAERRRVRCSILLTIFIAAFHGSTLSAAARSAAVISRQLGKQLALSAAKLHGSLCSAAARPAERGNPRPHSEHHLPQQRQAQPAARG